MKKIIITLLSVLLCITGHAQFFERVNYAGALSPDASKDWTKNWVEWNPNSSNHLRDYVDDKLFYSTSGIINITGTITLDSRTIYILKSLVVVRNGGKLIIPAGTVIKGHAILDSIPKQYASIVVERGGYISCDGTATNPVIFTSLKPAGQRNRGDWGGIIICGKAVNNQGADIQVEGFNNISSDATLAKHGGLDDNDNSGVIRYTRIEYGGLAFEPNKEINGLTLASVGRNTTIDHVQVSHSGDDSYEWFGGTVNCKYLISYKTTDDDFDTDFGYRGAVQFGIAFKDSSYFDLSWNAPSGSSTSETFESDNDASGSGRLPLTSAVFSNITCVGPVPAGMNWDQLSTTQKGAFRRGARIRRNSRQSIINSIFMGYRNFVMYDGDSVLVNSGVKSNTISDKNALFRNNYIWGVKSTAPKGATNTGLCETSTNGNPNTLDSWVRHAKNQNIIDTGYNRKGFLINTNNFFSPDFRPEGVYDSTNFSFDVLGQYGVLHVKSVGKINSVRAYPNPTEGQYTVDFSSTQSFNADVYLTDLNGRIVKNVTQTNVIKGENSVNVNLSDLSGGTYYFHIKGGNNSITYQVIVIK